MYVYATRMPRMQVYLPADLYDWVKQNRIPASELLQEAVRAQPPAVPSVVLVECWQGHAGRDANQNRFLKSCDIAETGPEPLARRGSALAVKPGGTVLISGPDDLQALKAHASNVSIGRIRVTTLPHERAAEEE